MLKWAIPFVVLALVAVGVFLALGDDPAHVPTSSGRSAPVEDERSPADFGDLPLADGAATDAAAGTGPAATGTGTAAAETPSGGATLTGRVVDETGAPVEGAILHLKALGTRDRGNVVLAGGGLPPLDSEEGRATTDAEGLFRYEGLDPAQGFALLARAEGWIGERRRDLRPGGDPIEIVLRAGEVVTGIVLDPAGRPVAGAAVRAGPTVATLGERLVIAVGGSFGDEEGVMPETTSAPDGTFVLTGIPHGKFSIAASHAAWSPSGTMNLMQGQTGVTLELRANSVVLGRVIDDIGAPVEGAVVATMGGFIGPGMRGGPTATSDATGAFRLEGLVPGLVHLSVRHAGHPSGSPEPVVAREGQVVGPIELVLARGARITGTALDPTGAPLADARVTLRRDADRDGGPRRHGGRSVATEADGAFGIVAPAPEPGEGAELWHVRIEHERFAAAESRSFAIASGAEIALGAIVLAEGIVIAGRVTDTEGSGIADAAVELVRGGAEGGGDFDAMIVEMIGGGPGHEPLRIVHGGGGGRVRTDENGNYRVPVEEPGTWRVAARAAGRQRVESAEIEVAERSVEGIDLALPPALSIAGTVVDELGAPCAGVTVHAMSGRRGEQSPKTGDDGRFVIDGLTAGAYDLQLLGDGWSLADVVPAAEAGEDGVVLVATRPGRIAGRIVERASGRPIPAFTIRSRPETQPGTSVFFSGFELGGVEYHDPDGRFLLEGLAPGIHKITVSAPGCVRNSESFEVFSATDTEATIELELAAIIVGRVVDAHGDPVEGAVVSTERLGGEGDAEETGELLHDIAIAMSIDGGGTFSIAGAGPGPERTDEEGRFRLDGVRDGEVRVKVEHGSFRPGKVEPVRARRGVETDAGTIALERGATIRGTVRREGGGSWVWSNVRVTPVCGGPEHTANPSGPEGPFEIGGLDAGVYTVVVDFMLDPQTTTGSPAMQQLQHDAGTVTVGIDEERSIDIVMP